MWLFIAAELSIFCCIDLLIHLYISAFEEVVFLRKMRFMQYSPNRDLSG